MAKPFSSLSNDLRAAAALAAEQTATDLVYELKRRGPYWDGLFEMAWEVHLGDVNIPADQQGKSPSPEPEQREITPVSVPPDRTNSLRGYTIGNRMEYRAIAMDLQPGRNAEGNERNYVAKGWYENFIQGGELLRVMAKSVRTGFVKRGFGK
jgi:hypothetical protein